MSKLARLKFIQSSLHAAVESYHESLQTLKRWGWESQPIAGLITAGMASLLYEWNALDQALAYARTSVERLKRWGHPFHVAEALIVLAKIEHARGHPDIAKEHLDTAIQHTRHRKPATYRAPSPRNSRTFGPEHGDLSRAKSTI